MGQRQHPHPRLAPSPHTSSEIRQAQSLIISEITKAALVTPAAEAASAQLALIIFQRNSCLRQSQTHLAEGSVAGWAGRGRCLVLASAPWAPAQCGGL